MHESPINCIHHVYILWLGFLNKIFKVHKLHYTLLENIASLSLIFLLIAMIGGIASYKITESQSKSVLLSGQPPHAGCRALQGPVTFNVALGWYAKIADDRQCHFKMSVHDFRAGVVVMGTKFVLFPGPTVFFTYLSFNYDGGVLDDGYYNENKCEGPISKWANMFKPYQTEDGIMYGDWLLRGFWMSHNISLETDCDCPFKDLYDRWYANSLCSVHLNYLDYLSAIYYSIGLSAVFVTFSTGIMGYALKKKISSPQSL